MGMPKVSTFPATWLSKWYDGSHRHSHSSKASARQLERETAWQGLRGKLAVQDVRENLPKQGRTSPKNKLCLEVTETLEHCPWGVTVDQRKVGGTGSFSGSCFGTGLNGTIEKFSNRDRAIFVPNLCYFSPFCGNPGANSFLERVFSREVNQQNLSSPFPVNYPT